MQRTPGEEACTQEVLRAFSTSSVGGEGDNVFEKESIVDNHFIQCKLRPFFMKEECIVDKANATVSCEEACTPVVSIAFATSSAGRDGGPLRFDFPPFIFFRKLWGHLLCLSFGRSLDSAYIPKECLYFARSIGTNRSFPYSILRIGCGKRGPFYCPLGRPTM